MEVVIPDAAAGDAGAVSRLVAELGYPTSVAGAEQGIARFASDPASRLQVAELGEQVVGLLATHVVPRLDDDALELPHHRPGRVRGSPACRHRLGAGRGGGARSAPRRSAPAGPGVRRPRRGFTTRARAFTKRLAPLDDAGER